jgi:hypothetical protein
MPAIAKLRALAPSYFKDHSKPVAAAKVVD